MFSFGHCSGATRPLACLAAGLLPPQRCHFALQALHSALQRGNFRRVGSSPSALFGTRSSRCRPRLAWRDGGGRCWCARLLCAGQGVAGCHQHPAFSLRQFPPKVSTRLALRCKGGLGRLQLGLHGFRIGLLLLQLLSQVIAFRHQAVQLRLQRRFGSAKRLQRRRAILQRGILRLQSCSQCTHITRLSVSCCGYAGFGCVARFAFALQLALQVLQVTLGTVQSSMQRADAHAG